MAVCTNHHGAGEGIIFQNRLMDDTGSGFPESDAIFRRDRGKKRINLRVDIQSGLEVCICPCFSLNEVIAMDRCGHCCFFHTAHHKLQKGHLGRSVLHGHAVWGKKYIVLPPGIIL